MKISFLEFGGTRITGALYGGGQLDVALLLALDNHGLELRLKPLNHAAHIQRVFLFNQRLGV